MQKTWVSSLGQEDALEKVMAIYSSILVWKIPWTEDPGQLQSMGCMKGLEIALCSQNLGLLLLSNFIRFLPIFRV